MRGLDPRILAAFITTKSGCLDGRVNPRIKSGDGHDDEELGLAQRVRERDLRAAGLQRLLLALVWRPA